MAVHNVDGESLPPDEEPKLKYDRMGNDVQNILLKDAVSCICVHTKFICLGTQWGVIHLLDHEGNTVPISQDGTGKELQAHAIAVNKISVDLNGDYIASCSDDGKVLVYGLYTTDNTHSFNVGREVKTIALDPYYFKSGSGRRFLTGDNKLTLYEKTFLNRVRSTVLCECEGHVQAMAWHDRFVAWASEVGVRIYDLVARCSLGLIQWEKSPHRNIEDYRCNLLWSAPKTLMIGWVDTIRICVIRKRSPVELQTRDVTEYLVDPIHTFPTDYYISGLGPFNDQLVLLGVPKECDPETGKPHRPVLTVADYKDCGEFCELSTDHLNIRGFDAYSWNDYHLDMLIEENIFFIVSPKDIVIASPNDIDDKVKWLTENGRFEKAITVLEEVGGRTSKNSVVAVGQLYLDHLISEKLYDDAAVLCARICKNDKALWENQILKFAEVNQLRAISPYVPKTPEQALSSHIYELIFYEYLKVDPHGFLKIVQTWNPALYKTGVIIKEVLEHLLTTEIEKNIYLEALALLYCYQKKYDKALTAYLKLQHKDVFNLIREHEMYNVIHDKILDLMMLDCDKTISVLLETKKSKEPIETKKTKVPVEVVQKQLANHEEFLYKYLHAYSKVEPNGWDHGMLVKLYAKYDKNKLLPFLKSSDNYPIQDALDVCQSNSFYPEMVFLLGRIGNTRDALQIIIEQLQDINQAINFCQEHNDKELWIDLIKQTIDKPEYVTLLLKRIGNYVDPRMLIENIQSGCEIKDLKDALAKMMCDYHLQLSVQEACKVITFHNYFDLHEKLIISQQRGISITDDFLCCECQGRIISKDLSNASDLMVYNCRHSFHIGCLPGGAQCQNCTVCSAVKM